MFRSDSTAQANLVRRLPRGGGDFSPAPTFASPRQLSLIERAAKRTMDIIGALVFFAIFGPLYVLVALGVRISMGGPVHFGQTRMGVDGKAFRFYKFRSMVCNSEEILDEYLSKNEAARLQWDKFQKLDNDPRITPLGHFIRKLSLDELPQFWNVLKGDMSIVGPRPCMERQRSLYGKHWGHYCAVRPGLTGLWQVSGRNHLSYAQRVELDAQYVNEWSLWLDIKILAKTVITVITGDGSR